MIISCRSGKIVIGPEFFFFFLLLLNRATLLGSEVYRIGGGKGEVGVIILLLSQC